MSSFHAVFRSKTPLAPQHRAAITLCGFAAGLHIGLVTSEEGYQRTLFFDEVGNLSYWRESGAFESYRDSWVERVTRDAEDASR